MKRNRKVKKNSVLKSGSVGAASLIVSILIMAMIYYMLDSRCDLINRDIGKAERRLSALESEYVRETARWDELRVTERLSDKLTRFGLEMRYPRQDQIVRMNADGRPQPGLAVTRALARQRVGDLALNATGSSSPSAGRRAGAIATTKRGVRR